MTVPQVKHRGLREQFDSRMEFAAEYLDEEPGEGRPRALLLDLAAHSHHAALERLADMVDAIAERLDALEELPRQLAELQSDVHENMGQGGGCGCQ